MVPLLQTYAICLFPTSKLLSSETHEICFNVNKEVLVPYCWKTHFNCYFYAKSAIAYI